MHGNLYCIAVQRIPAGCDYDDYLAANNGSIDGPVFSVAVAHVTKDDEPYYVAFCQSKIIESDDLDQIGDLVMQHLKEFSQLTKTEEQDLQQIFCIQEDADYDLDREKWLYYIGNSGEISGGDDSFDGGLIVNVMPVYNTPITEQGSYDSDVQPADEHEFCGLRRPI